MNRNQNIFVFDKDFASLGQKTAVSLHCHTQHSKEKLNFLPHYIKKTGMFSSFLQRKMEDYAARKKRAIDFDTGYWLPPMSPREVYNSEVQEIREKLGVHAVVSITDHDDVDAGQLLNVIGIHDAPVSTEWTVPYDRGIFHFGIHNLPPDRASRILTDLLAYTNAPETKRLGELLRYLNEFKDTLVVVNHPLWDLNYQGDNYQKSLAMDLLSRFGLWIHALEINGYRRKQENRDTVALAHGFDLPLISGGDRHGRVPNALLNVTCASTMSEFV